jgi:hypothetical protein
VQAMVPPALVQNDERMWAVFLSLRALVMWGHWALEHTVQLF